MALDFPTPTTVGQEFTQGSLTYIWDGVKWVSQSSASSSSGGITTAQAIAFAIALG